MKQEERLENLKIFNNFCDEYERKWKSKLPKYSWVGHEDGMMKMDYEDHTFRITKLNGDVPFSEDDLLSVHCMEYGYNVIKCSVTKEYSINDLLALDLDEMTNDLTSLLKAKYIDVERELKKKKVIKNCFVMDLRNIFNEVSMIGFDMSDGSFTTYSCSLDDGNHYFISLCVEGEDISVKIRDGGGYYESIGKPNELLSWIKRCIKNK
ncbi:MAG: hypothetical protein MJZ34_06960 [Paludibacteraceae bacterium]|nr:hypothetical protein [Paludibacteraceae bacterium]